MCVVCVSGMHHNVDIKSDFEMMNRSMMQLQILNSTHQFHPCESQDITSKDGDRKLNQD